MIFSIRRMIAGKDKIYKKTLFKKTLDRIFSLAIIHPVKFLSFYNPDPSG